MGIKVWKLTRGIFDWWNLMCLTWCKQSLNFDNFYRAMLWIRGTSHGPVSVRLSVRHRPVHRRKLLLGPGAQAPPTFMIMGLAYMTSSPLLWRDIVLIVFQLFALVLRNADKSTVLDIFVKGLNLPAPLDIQWPKCFQLQGVFHPYPMTRGSAQTTVISSCSAHAMVPPTTRPFHRLWSSRLEPPTYFDKFTPMEAGLYRIGL